MRLYRAIIARGAAFLGVAFLSLGAVWAANEVSGAVRGGTLSIAMNAEPSVLTSAFDTLPQTQLVSSKIAEGLLAYDQGFNPLPQLATRWLMSPDGLRITFELRESVSWHDGRPFTSADVAFSVMNVWKELHGRGRSTFANVISVETPGPNQAIFVLSKPSPYILNALAASESPILPKHIYEGKDIRTNAANTSPIGTGPFRFKSWDRGSNIVLERNPAYWQPQRPYLDRIVFMVIPDPAGRAAALESGQVLLTVQSGVPLSDVKRLAALPTLEYTTAGYRHEAASMLVEFNLDRPQLQDLRVRRAIAHAIEPAFIAENIRYGFGEVATGPIPQTQKKFYSADVARYPYNPALANKLLDEAGKGRGEQKVRFRLTIDPIPAGDVYIRAAEYLRQSLADVGIDLVLRNQDFPSYVRRVYSDRDFDLTLTAASATADPAIGIQRFYWSKNLKRGVAFTNTSNYRSPDADRLLEGASSEIDPEKRSADYAEFQRVVMTDLPIIPLVAVEHVTLANKRVRNHSVAGDGVYSNFADVYLIPK